MLECPFCSLIGCLILNGCLYGYTEDSAVMAKKGHRILCSNRKNRKGCGRSFSILRADCIRYFRISAITLWIFLCGLMKNLPVIKAFRNTGSRMVQTTAYRIYNRFKTCQPRIRSFLSRITGPPHMPDSIDPVVQTISHLTNAFPHSPCPVSEYQCFFSSSFLSIQDSSV